ncbi:MAG: hypothetical protein A3K83_02890 [Omnitrophica WOR_2 bacterium RBG_13_44_8b]|nr:MAG: hypothetical protein A3K83_02890 [Omnitrophica WOR_2 bacterium RBG_13_44_8b]
MKKGLFFLLSIAFMLGCARVRVEAPKDPIKVDISMRLDIYQHVAKDIDEIENIVSGSKDKPQSKNGSSLLGYFVTFAYAQDSGLSPEVEQAALRRKDRRTELATLEGKGTVGENKSGLVEIKVPEQSDASAESLVNAENNDRMVIYEAVARKNGTSVAEVQKLYAKRLQQDAPTGTPIEVLNESSGAYEWKIKS